MDNQDKPYEQPTDDLRQVRHEVYDFPRLGNTAHRVLSVYYTVQRRWEVQDGEIQGNLYGGSPGPFSLRKWTPLPWTTSWVYLKDEWRDLPVVHAPVEDTRVS